MFRGISGIALRRVARRWLALASIPLVMALALAALALRAQPHHVAATVAACSTPDATGAGTCSSPVPSVADTPAATPTDTPATTPTDTPAPPTVTATATLRPTPQPTPTPFPSTGESAVLVPCGASSGDHVGDSVAVTPDGNELVAGAPMTGSRDGAAYILSRTAGAWRQDARLTVADAATGAFGAAVAVSADGGTALVAAPLAGAGRVYVFSRGPLGWGQTAELTAPNSRSASDQFGSAISVSADGLTAAISQPRYFSNGTVYVFTRSGSAWSPVATLTAADPTSNDGFGRSLALDAAGTRLVLGDSRHASVDVYDLAAGQWARSSTLADPQTSTAALQVALSPDGGTVLAGDTDYYGTTSSAAVFVDTGGSWTPGRTISKPGTPNNGYGIALALSADGSRALVGDHGSTTPRGLVYLVDSTGGSWSSQQELKNPLPSDGDLFGDAVALDGDGAVAAVGAGGFDNTGAVLLYEGSTPNAPETVHC